nr:transposase [Marinicella sp. W31]MDC2879439.1 transposase [Marinicella sp. W31]
MIAAVDGLKGFPQVIEAAFPRTQVQTCIVTSPPPFHELRQRQGPQGRRQGAQDGLHGRNVEAAEQALATFEGSDLARCYPAIAPSWRRAWNAVIPFLDYPPEVRRLIYTTNSIEALNSKIRRAVRARGHFPSDEAAAKLVYLALNATFTGWKRSVRECHAVKSQLAIRFEQRFPMSWNNVRAQNFRLSRCHG